jgi:hypothetical protein
MLPPSRTIPSPSIPPEGGFPAAKSAPEGKLIIQVDGPATVKSVSFEGAWDAVLNRPRVRAASNTGRRDVLPP